MKKVLALILFLLFVFLFPFHSFANEWLTDHKDFTRNANVGNAVTRSDLSVQWTKTPTLSSFQMPIYQDGIFYFSEESNSYDPVKTWSVYAVSKNTGEEIWRRTGSGLLRCSPSVLGGTIIIPGEYLVALNSRTGTELWNKKAANNYFYIHPMIFEHKIFVVHKNASYNGSLVSINLTDGSENWNKSIYLYGYNPPSIYKDNVIMTTGLSSNFSVVRSYRMSDGALNWVYQRNYNPNSSVVVDENRGIGLLSLAVNAVSAIDLGTGQNSINFGVGSYASKSILSNGITYFLTYQSNSTFFNACNYVSGGCFLHQKISSNLIYDPRVTPVLAGERFYFTSNDGRLYEVNISDGISKSYLVDASAILAYSIFADGSFILSDYYLRKLYVLGDGAEPITADSQVVLDSPYKTDGEYHPYLGQLHSHYIPDIPKWSKLFNGDPSPAFTESRYKEAGYDFVALTEHNKVISNPNVGGILHISNSEEDTQDHGGNHILALGTRNPIDETLGDQARINQVMEQGGVPILAHPNSKQYNWTLKKLFEMKNYNEIEIKNNAIGWLDPFRFAGSSLSTDKWDNLLSSGKRIYGTAGDDYTPGDGSFDGAAVMVFSKKNNQAEILSNLRSGNFYTLQGSKAPKINIVTSNNQIIVNSDRQSAIRFISKGRVVKEIKDVNMANYFPSGSEAYVRIEVEAGSKKSWSQPIFVNQKQTLATPFPGGYLIKFSEGILSSKNISQVQFNSLLTNENPIVSPRLGYISQVYSISSANTPQEGTQLTLNYDEKGVLTNEGNLSIYKYNNNQWEKVPSSVDTEANTVTAPISESSRYTLSAEEPYDAVKPIVNLVSPAELTNLKGNTEFKVNASDNNAVIVTGFYIDGNLVSEDGIADDGWSMSFNVSDYSAGEHKLLITAEDLSGNIEEKEYTFSVADSLFRAPEILISEPAENADLWSISKIIGSFSSSLPVSNVSISLDGYFVGEGEVNGNVFSKEINWSDYKEGTHVLKVLLADNRGHIAEAKRNINIGENIKVDILSLFQDKYFESDKIMFAYRSSKDNLIGKIDGKTVTNNSTRYGYELGLGQHLFALEYNSKVIIERKFSVITSISDLQKVVNLLYSRGHFNNRNAYISIKTQLSIAAKIGNSTKIYSRNLLLVTIMKLNIQYKKRPIDNFAYNIILGSLRTLRII